MIAIIDTGGANHASIQNALLRLDCPSEVTLDPLRIDRASHIILPGVGHAAYAMDRIEKAGLRPLLLAQKKPVLGICLGMQILFSHSEEGDVACLGLFSGRVRKLEPTEGFRVPHMGWNQLGKNPGHPEPSQLLKGIDPEAHFYFVHSYFAPDHEAITFSTRSSGREPKIPAVLEAGNFYATQFHPERSSEHGALLLKNFLNS